MQKGAVFRLATLVFLLALWRPDLVRAELNCSENIMCLSKEKVGDTTVFFAINKMPHLALTVGLELTLDNLVLIGENVRPFVLKGGERRRLFALSPIDRERDWEYAYEYQWVGGDISSPHQDTYRYRLPYEADDIYAVSQSCHGAFSHTGSGRYAIDFDMPVRTPVLAARSGLVVDVKQDSTRGGEDESYEDDANFVTIEHEDGSLGQYFHLHPNSVSVALGQWVAAGDVLGQSGNTGFSTGPHLHFEVTAVQMDSKTNDLFSESVPITFATRRGPVTCPAEGAELPVE